jgi:WD40 repeat protein
VLATLDRLTDSPVNVRLAISHDGTLDIWDLATGKGRIDVANGPENLDFTQPVIRLGAGALFATDQGFRLVRTDGSTAARLPSASGYLPAGDNAVWLMLPSGFRRYDSHGHAVGPAYPPPPAFADGGALSATANSLVMAENNPDTQMQTAALWTPSTGKVRPVGSACVGAITGSRDAIAYVGCDQESLTVMDARSGRVRTVHAPPRTVVDEGGMALSPDGSRLAFRASPLDGVDTNSSLVVFDARTGGVTVIAQAAVPLSWSPDGTTLLVSSDVGENAYSIPLGYWRTGMDHPVPIRITLTGQSVSAVLLP